MITQVALVALIIRAEGSHVTDPEPDPAEDPWLTLAEIAGELRVNPATVRLWISRGKLKAKRAGQRKLLVQRSELNRMLEASSHRYDNVPTASQAMSYPRTAAPRRPVRVRTWSVYGVGKAKVPPEVMHAAVKQLQQAGAVWDAALEASENAPPDPGFVGRLRAIAEAAERQARIPRVALLGLLLRGHRRRVVVEDRAEALAVGDGGVDGR